MFYKIGVIKRFQKFTEIHLHRSLCFNKYAVFQSGTLLRKILPYKCFSVNFAKFLRIPIFQNASQLLLFHFELVISRNDKEIQKYTRKCLYICITILYSSQKRAPFSLLEQNIVSQCLIDVLNIHLLGKTSMKHLQVAVPLSMNISKRVTQKASSI